MNTLTSQASYGCDYLADKQELVQAVENNDVPNISFTIITATKEIWSSNMLNIPDFITVTDSYGKILTQLVRNQNSDNSNLYEVITPEEKKMETIEIISALEGITSSAFGANSLSKLYYNTAKGIVATESNTVVGTISLGYKLDNTKYVDDIKGEKELDVSFFYGEQKSMLHTLKE